jgi:excisionase family DNA binding protein
MPKKIGDLKLFSVDDLHEMLGISKMTIRAYLRDGKLQGRKMGVKWFVTEDSLRRYFEGAEAESESKPDEKKLRYIVQGINDLVSETEECDSIKSTIECIKSQAIISLFQVAVVDRESDEVIELVKARDFLDRHDQ